MKKILVTGVLIFSLVLSACSQIEEFSGVSVTPSSHDFGEIIQNNGIVSTTFKVLNTGPGPLIINRLSTSCGCTTAKMDKSTMQPGEERDMIVTFDPMVHPDQFGEIERVVYLQTSDPKRPELEINITGTVVP